MAREVYLLPQAQEDLDIIRDPLFAEILERIQLLAEYPLWGASIVGPFSGYSSCVVGFWCVVYKGV